MEAGEGPTRVSVAPPAKRRDFLSGGVRRKERLDPQLEILTWIDSDAPDSVPEYQPVVKEI